MVMQYLLNLAFIDGEFSQTEYMIIEDIANAIEIKRADLKLLSLSLKLINNKKNQAKWIWQKLIQH